MNRIKYILLWVCLAGCLAACKKNTVVEFDEAAQFQKDTVLIREYIRKNGLDMVKSSDYGIFYQVIAPGEGTSIDGLSVITADYTGKIMDGEVFETSTNSTFPLKNVIPCWYFALQQIKKGGTIRFISPSFYGYKNIANNKIPANSILDFTVTVTDVN